MKKQFTANFQISPQARHETVDGKDFLVVPVVALVEGVLNKSLAHRDVFAVNVQAWEGVPVPVTHPTTAAGAFLSAKDKAAEPLVIGTFKNVTWDVDRLKGELWLDVAEANAKGYANVVGALEAGKVMEVSTGFYAEYVEVPGAFKNEEYQRVWTNIEPDHLALLPGDVGACSVKDGCGTYQNRGFMQRLMDRARKAAGQRTAADLAVNELSFDATRASLSKALAAESADLHFIHETFADYVIYEKTPDMSRQGKLFRRSYSVQDDKVTLEGDAAEVEQVLSYQPVKNSQEEKTMDRKQRVTALIANGKATEADRAHLEALADASFEVFAKACGCPQANAQATQTPAPAAGVTLEQVSDLVSKTVTAVLAANEAKKTDAEKAELRTALKVNAVELTDDEFKATPITVLQSMLAKLQPAAYGARFTPAANVTTEKVEDWGAGEVFVNASQKGAAN